MKNLAILFSPLLLTLASCSNEEIFIEETNANYEKQISVVAEDLTSAADTRTSYTEGENGYHFAWSEGDELGIFPTDGRQTDFPISNGYGSNTAVFDGGKWALRSNESYAAYYPLIHDFDLDPTAIPVNYTGQIQNGNGSTAHLSAYDYMASTFTEVDAKGNVNFQLQHLGCLVQFKLAMPAADTYSALEITSDKTLFITSGEYSLSDDVHVFHNKQESNSFTIGLSNVSTTVEEKELAITAMFAPVNLSDSKLTLTVKGDIKDYIFEIDGQNLAQGKTVNSQYIPYVTFHADEVQTLKMSKAVATLEYSLNGFDWAELGTNTVAFGGVNGDLKLRGSNGYGTANEVSDFGFSNNARIIMETEAKVSCSGDIRTLADYRNYWKEDTQDDRFCDLFRDCTPLISAPSLPATLLASHCYSNMFCNCTSLKEAPVLHAMTISPCCYTAMFASCSALKYAPALPATIMAEYCYAAMFSGCADLHATPDLPATSLASFCYSGMFAGCSTLSSGPSLPATELAEACYYRMFENSSIFQAPSELPATTLAVNCYYRMFANCRISTAPILPALTLVAGCYQEMFSGCQNLTQIQMMATDISASSCLDRWVDDVQWWGIFTKNKNASWNNSGVVPYGWEVNIPLL